MRPRLPNIVGLQVRQARQMSKQMVTWARKAEKLVSLLCWNWSASAPVICRKTLTPVEGTDDGGGGVGGGGDAAGEVCFSTRF